MVTVAIAGGTTGIGSNVVREILATNKHRVVVLSRSERPALEEKGVSVSVVDYSSAQSLETALQGVHTVISCIWSFGPDFGTSQLALLKAAEDAGVPGDLALVGTSPHPLAVSPGGKAARASHGSRDCSNPGIFVRLDAEWLGGMAAITGAYLAGLFVATTPAREKVVQDIHPMINALFGPIFFVSIGLEVNARHVTGRMAFFGLLLLIAIVGKIVGCGLGAFASGFSKRESLVVGVGMIPRGEVGLITASLGFAAGLVASNVYAQIVVLVLLTTLVTPLLLRFAFPDHPIESTVDDLGMVEIQDIDTMSSGLNSLADA